MTFECKKLRDAARDQVCVRCGNPIGVVGCHYTGVRRLSYGGGYGQKVHDFLIADLCPGCHLYMDQLSRDKSKKWEHSEEFQHYIILTIERRFVQGLIVVGRNGHAENTEGLVERAQSSQSAESLSPLGSGAIDQPGEGSTAIGETR